MNRSATEAVIRCDSVWKIFGPKADQALQAVSSAGLFTAEIRNRFGRMVGAIAADPSILLLDVPLSAPRDKLNALVDLAIGAQANGIKSWAIANR